MQRFLVALFLLAISSVKVCAAEDVEPEGKLCAALLQTSSGIVTDNIAGLEKQVQNLKEGYIVLQRSNKAMSAFLAHMSHELRNLLNGLLGMLDIIELKKLLDEDRSRIELAKNAGHSMLGILNDILDISKIEAGKLELESIAFEARSIAQEVIKLLETEVQKKDMIFDFNVSPKVPICLKGDQKRLHQILFNLVGNAVKFTQAGTVSLSLDGDLDKEDENLFWLMGQVKDTGIGMNQETQEALFRPFMQADASTSRKFGGTGLGLVITRELCKLMGGTVKVTSELGAGSTFEFKVAMKIVSLSTPDFPAPSLVSASSGEKTKNLKILVDEIKEWHLDVVAAEDNEINQKILKNILEKLGCSSRIVPNGQEAIDECKRKKPDLVLMDGEMPIMGGLEACQILRKEFTQEQLLIIGVSAHAMKESEETFLTAGMNGYLTKPVNIEALAQSIFQYLPSSRRVSTSHSLLRCPFCGL